MSTVAVEARYGEEKELLYLYPAEKYLIKNQYAQCISRGITLAAIESCLDKQRRFSEGSMMSHIMELTRDFGNMWYCGGGGSRDMV